MEKKQSKKFITDYKEYLELFMERNNLKIQNWLANNKKYVQSQLNYFLNKKIEHAEQQLLADQARIVKEFRISMEDVLELKKHHPQQSFRVWETSLRDDFERRMAFTQKIWNNYINECKKNQK